MAIKIWTGASSGALGTTGNWNGGSPAAGDTVIFQPGYTNAPSSGLTALNTATLSGALGPVIFAEGWNSGFGSSLASPLQFTATRVDFWSSAAIYLDLEASTCSPQVFNTALAVQGDAGLYLIGSALTALLVQGGTVGLAMRGGQTATVATARCIGNGSKLYLGSGVSLTDSYVADGGTVVQRCASTTAKAIKGTLITEETGAITTLTAYEGAIVYPNSTGTITTLNIEHPTSSVDFRQNPEARTVTTMNWKHGALKFDKNVLTITTFSAPGVSGELFEGKIL